MAASRLHGPSDHESAAVEEMLAAAARSEAHGAGNSSEALVYGAFFDLLTWRREEPHADLVLAMPDYPTYRNLAKRVEWLRRLFVSRSPGLVLMAQSRLTKRGPCYVWLHDRQHRVPLDQVWHQEAPTE